MPAWCLCEFTSKATDKRRLSFSLLHRIRKGITNPGALLNMHVRLVDELYVAGPLENHDEIGSTELEISQFFSLVEGYA